MNQLFQPLSIKSVHLKNRIVMSPMCQYSSTEGYAGEWHYVHYGTRAVGGAALIVLEASAISTDGRISQGDLGIWNDEHIAGLKRITAFIREQKAVAGIQLAHAGRKASINLPSRGDNQLAVSEGGWQPLAPSPLPYRAQDMIPAEMNITQINKLILEFKEAALRALKSGFQVIEIHAAHGYLLHQFLSPLSNHRTDAYGGSFTNRTRLILEVTDAVNEVWPSDLPLFVRVSATDWAEGGWDIEQSVQLAALLKEKGVDLIDTSSGGLTMDQKIELQPGYQVPFAHRIKKESSIMTGAVGLITTATQAEEVLKQQSADLIFLGRELLRNPYFPLQAAYDLQENIQWPAPYERARKR